MGATLVWFLSTGIAIGFGVTFFIAINALLNGAGAIVGTTLVGEIFGILSLCLPFSLTQLLGGIGVIAAAVISFLSARKIFTILMDILGATKA